MQRQSSNSAVYIGLFLVAKAVGSRERGVHRRDNLGVRRPLKALAKVEVWLQKALVGVSETVGIFPINRKGKLNRLGNYLMCVLKTAQLT